MQDMRNKQEYIHNKNFNKIIEEICDELNITYQYLSKNWVMELSKDGKTKYICGYKFDTVGHGLGEIFDDKYAMFCLLKSHDIPVIEHHIVYSDTNNHSYALDCRGFEYVSSLFETYNSNVVLKANRGSCGTGVYHVTDLDKLKEIYEHLLSHRPSFSLCPFCDIKNEFRAICVNGQIELLYKKTRPQIIGDGVKTIKELLIEFNPNYFEYYNGDDADKVLEKDAIQNLGWKFNLSQGSISSLDILAEEKNNINRIVSKIANSIDLGFCSVDIIRTEDDKYLVMEINSGVMMENYILQHENGYNVAKDIYKKAIISMMEIK